MRQDLLREVLEAREGRRPLVLVTRLHDGRQWVEIEGEQAGAPEADKPSLPSGVPEASTSPLPASVSEAARAALRRDRSEVVEDSGARFFLHVMAPPLRLFVVGAVHIAQSLVPMGSLLGYAVTVIDPRRAFATAERFPGVSVTNDWPDDALNAAGLDARCAVVTLTHDPKIDDPALHAALASPAFYIGSLGSRRTHGKRVDRLTAHGVPPEAIARIHAPVGLDIGAQTAPEIAASIVAELTARFRMRGDG